LNRLFVRISIELSDVKTVNILSLFELKGWKKENDAESHRYFSHVLFVTFRDFS